MSRFAYERAIRRSGLPAPARHIALTLATWADLNTCVIPDRYMPSLATLTEATGQGKSTVARYLITLEEAGWIGRRQRKASSGSHNEITHYTLAIPASAQAEEGSEEVVPERDKGSSQSGTRVGSQRDKGSSQSGTQEFLSSGSTYQSPRAGAGEDRTGPASSRRDGSTKKTSISSDLDAAADAARAELSQATGREVRPDWARKVAIAILDAARSPISDGRHAAYVRTAIQRERDLSRFLPTPTATSSRSEEAFLPEEPAEDTPAPPALTLHTTTKPRTSRTPTGQPPLLASVPDTGPPPVDVRARAAEARARIDAARTAGDT